MSDRIGPDLTILPGQVGKMFITGPLVENQDGTGYTGLTPGGGVVILQFSEGGFGVAREAKAKEAIEKTDPRFIASGRAALNAWAYDPLFRSRDFWAKENGIDPATLASLCDEKPDRSRPPLRDIYERARDIRKARGGRRRRTEGGRP